ncbi:MAG: aldo/keto reductase [Deltaproteobacteria bacterium]|nr:MAG: aldo/keto reductase [Deltaproteobacteria bacterium]
MMRRARTVVLSLVVAAVIGWGVAGHYIYYAFIGLDPGAFPAGWVFERVGEHLFPPVGFTVGGMTLALAVLIAMALASYVIVGRAVRASRPADDGRRRFLAGAASGGAAALATLAVGGAAAVANAWYGVGRGGRGWRGPVDEIFEAKVEQTAPEWRDEWKGSRVQAHRRLGRTNWMVSDIVLGTGAISGTDGERIARLAIDRGVNYFDTSPDYSGAGTEDAMGRAIKGKRDELFIATKFCTPYGHLPPGTPVAEYMQAIEGSLRRLGTDHVDLVHIHSCDEVERLLDPNAHEAFDRLKEQGKVRFLGVSTHTPNLVAVADAAIASNRFDVIMLAYHHGIWAPLAGITRRARHGRGRDEDPQGRQAPRPRRLPRSRRQLHASGVQVGALEPEGVVRRRLVLRAAARRRIPLRVGPRRRRERRRDPGRVRSPDPRQLLRSALRRVSRPLPRGATDPRRAPPAHVLRGLRLGKGGDAPLRRAREERRRLRDVPRAVPPIVSRRRPDPGANDRRA